MPGLCSCLGARLGRPGTVRATAGTGGTRPAARNRHPTGGTGRAARNRHSTGGSCRDCPRHEQIRHSGQPSRPNSHQVGRFDIHSSVDVANVASARIRYQSDPPRDWSVDSAQGVGGTEVPVLSVTRFLSCVPTSWATPRQSRPIGEKCLCFRAETPMDRAAMPSGAERGRTTRRRGGSASRRAEPRMRWPGRRRRSPPRLRSPRPRPRELHRSGSQRSSGSSTR